MTDDWAEWIAERVLDLAGVLGFHAYEAASDTISEARKRQAAQRGREALAGIDILLLAALHDHVITEAERHALELRIAELLRKSGLEDVSEDRLHAKEERWTGWRAECTEAEFRNLVKQRVSVLGKRSRQGRLRGRSSRAHGRAHARRLGVSREASHGPGEDTAPVRRAHRAVMSARAMRRG